MVFRWSRNSGLFAGLIAVWATLVLCGCRTGGTTARRESVAGDEIIVAGQRFHTGTRVVTWSEPGGYDGYAGTVPLERREGKLSASRQRRVERDGWTLPLLRRVVDQAVLHYDACGLSQVCFAVLQQRGLSVHFLLDVDGTVYQTLDLQERAQHATIANDRSIGIEIANIGAYPPEAAQPLDAWYRRDAEGAAVLRVPARIRDAGIRTPDFIARPARPERVRGTVQGRMLEQYDLTPEQYAALAKLTAALCRALPRIRADYPRDSAGRPLLRRLPERDWENYRGVLGHFHLQDDKVDPGPAFQWEPFLRDVQRARR